jgi:hypothetical protein
MTKSQKNSKIQYPNSKRTQALRAKGGGAAADCFGVWSLGFEIWSEATHDTKLL